MMGSDHETSDATCAEGIQPGGTRAREEGKHETSQVPRVEGYEIFRNLSERARVAFYRMSLPDGRYEYISSGCNALTGYGPEEYYRGPLFIRELIHPDSRAYFAQAWERLLAGEMPSSYEYAIVDRNGHKRWLQQQNILIRDDEGRPVAIEGVISESTAHKRHQAELERLIHERSAELEGANDRLHAEIAAHQQALANLRSSESHLRLLTDNLPAAISYVDADERYRFNNRTCEDWFGYTHAEILGKTVREVLGAEAYAVIKDHVRGALSGRAVTFEASVPYANRGTRYVRASYIPHWDDARCNVTGFFALASDITDAKRAEAAERRHLQELAHTARLASVGEMASELSHELAQPLAAIVNYSHGCAALLEDGRVDEAKDIAAKLRAQSELAAQIVRGFRRFVQKGVPEKHRVDLCELVQSALKLVRWEADARGVPLTFEAPVPVPPVYADRTLIEQVVLNLVRNALDAIGGRAAWDKPITVAIQAQDDAVEVSVRDYGAGLAPEAKAHLFEPFFTTKPDGVGIGLVICRRIIESHGGRLWTEDNPDGQGALFRFSLPAAKGAL